MFNFDEKKVYTDHLNGVNMIPQVEKVVDKICEVCRTNFPYS